VVADDGSQVGILSSEEALKMAKEKDLDLVEVAPQANPPVCRIMNFGKYQYQMSKRLHEAKKHQKQIIMKEVKFRPRIDEHDFQFKSNHIRRFLAEGNKAKATVMFRGREMAHTDIGHEILGRLIEELKNEAEVEREPKQEGYTLSTILTPKRKQHLEKSVKPGTKPTAKEDGKEEGPVKGTPANPS